MSKLITVLAILGLNFSANAAKFDSEVENFMIEGAVKKCSISRSADFNLEKVTIQTVPVDQGVKDYVYTAIFTVSYLGNDEQTLVQKQVKVRAAEYSFSSPVAPKMKILSVTSPDNRICD